MATIVQVPSWTYLGTATEERRKGLASPSRFADVVKAMNHQMTVVCFHREPRQRDDSYSRATFCAVIGVTLFDAFFNSVSGYRGAYFESPDKGLAANRFLIDEISPALISWALASSPEVDKAWLEESLALPTAKAWLAEDNAAQCAKCAGEWSASYVSELEIANGRWELSPHTHARWGRQAPYFSKIRVFGCFLNDQHHEWVADHKRERAQQISEHGWT